MILVVLALCLVLPLGLKATELDYPKTDKFQLFKDGDPYERYCCSEKYQVRGEGCKGEGCKGEGVRGRGVRGEG